VCPLRAVKLRSPFR